MAPQGDQKETGASQRWRWGRGLFWAISASPGLDKDKDKDNDTIEHLKNSVASTCKVEIEVTTPKVHILNMLASEIRFRLSQGMIPVETVGKPHFC